MSPRSIAHTGDFDDRSRRLPTPALIERQERLRRVVAGILATAVLILLVAGIRAAVGKGERASAEGSPAAPAPPPTAQAAGMGLAPAAEVTAAPVLEPAAPTVPAADSKPAAAAAPKAVTRGGAPRPRPKGKSSVGARPF
jgi:hypothetical protein